MYKNLFTNNRKINKKYLILLILLAIIIGGYFYSRSDTDFSGIEKIKSYFLNFRFTARLDEPEIKESQIASLSDQMSFEEETQGITEKLTEEALLLEKTKDVLGQEITIVPTTVPEKKKPTLEEISEQVNEISKKITIISVQVQELSLKELKATLAQITEQGETSEEIQPALEEVAEKVNGISEKIETITAQLEQLLSEQTY